MPVPTYDEFIEPLLYLLAEHTAGIRAADAHEVVADRVGLDDADKQQLLPSGIQPLYKNRIGWAHDRLKRAGLSSSPKRGFWMLTPAGKAFVKEQPNRLDPDKLEALKRVPADSRVPQPEGEALASTAELPPESGLTTASPEERIESALRELHETVAGDLLDLIGSSSPLFFEQVVLDLLHALGYGLDRGALQRVGRSGDGGIDGIISLDRLGLEKVYVQAKRWRNTVGRPEIQAFFGALAGHRASKGVFITTSTYSREAQEYAAHVSDSLVLVDGARLAGLMIEHGVGVSHRNLRVAKVDSDYFEEA